jgi:starch phosphorylase
MSAHVVSLETALQVVPRTTVFTTHTPVSAGHDEFPPALINPILKTFEQRLGVSEETILSWGQPAGSPPEAPLSMFVLGRRMARYCNGVSRLHGEVARKMWSFLWPERPVEEVPIAHVTNGIHVSTWVSPENARLFEQYLGPEWYLSSRKSENISRIDEILDEELWRSREMSRSRLIAACRDRMLKQYGRRNAPATTLEDAGTVLDHDALTIGFARRFATYKRATLLLRDSSRLERLLGNGQHPVQLIFAGKAHPRDGEGKEFIRQIITFAQRYEVRHKVAFLEDYDMDLARFLVQGVDVWLNTPRRPFEACGTSGMKAAVNGVLNVSILDGWWAEAYSPDTGWAIGNAEAHPDDADYQDTVDAEALYNILENEIIPEFYDRKNGGVPVRWLGRMRASMKMAMRDFCGMRMVQEYAESFYLPAAQAYDALSRDACAEAVVLEKRQRRLETYWKEIRVEAPVLDAGPTIRVGDTLRFTARAHLGTLHPDEVEVQLYIGQLKTVNALAAGGAVKMTLERELGDGDYLYACNQLCENAGRHGYTARVVPGGDGFIKGLPGLMTWS